MLIAGTGPSFGFFDLDTMASQTPVPNSHRKYDLETDGIAIIAHTPPKRLGPDARDATKWTRNGGRSKDDPFMVDDDDEIQEIYETSSIRPSRPGTSWQTSTSPNMTASTTLVSLSVGSLMCHRRIRLPDLRHSKPRIRIFKRRATRAQALQRPLVHITTILNPYHDFLWEAQGLCLRLCPPSQAKLAEHTMSPFSRTLQTTRRAFSARERTQNNQI